MVEYDSGERTSVALSASAGAVDVCLSTPSLQLEPAYIGLCSQRTLKIVNRSEIPVKFSWKAFATVDEEEVRSTRVACGPSKRCNRPSSRVESVDCSVRNYKARCWTKDQSTLYRRAGFLNERPSAAHPPRSWSLRLFFRRSEAGCTRK